MWKYQQSTGNLFLEDDFVTTGYAGRNEGKNNPDLQNVHNIGPIPKGKYTINKPFTHPKLGKFAISLTPFLTNEMFGRSAFYIHGDSIKNPGTASEGCIIVSLKARQMISASCDKVLEVE